MTNLNLTTTFISANVFETLGLDWMTILFYVINLIILIAFLTLLLYKPIKKMLKKNREKIDEIYEENDRLKHESDELKSKYDEMVSDAKVESVRVAAEVAESAQVKSEEIIAAAQKQADEIISEAKKNALVERERYKTEYKDSVGTLAVEIAQKLLEREVSKKDNSVLIEEVLSDWEGDK